MRALNRGHVREFNPDRKDTHWGKRKLKSHMAARMARELIATVEAWAKANDRAGRTPFVSL
jgi:hypothetical protein